MKRVVYTLLMISLLCTVGCNEKNSPVVYDPDLSNLNRYFVEVDGIPKMQFTKLNFAHAGTSNIDGVVYYRYRIQSEGRNETHGFHISFDLLCHNSTMIEIGSYKFDSSPSNNETIYMNNLNFNVYELGNERNGLANSSIYGVGGEVHGNMRDGKITKEGCVLSIAGFIDGVINGEHQYNAKVIWGGVITEELLTGKDFTVEYQQ